MKNYYPQSKSDGVGDSYYRALAAEQKRRDNPIPPQSRIVDGFDLSDPLDFAFWNVARQIKKENETKEQKRD